LPVISRPTQRVFFSCSLFLPCTDTCPYFGFMCCYVYNFIYN
jgi:hypothetical protein